MPKPEEGDNEPNNDEHRDENSNEVKETVNLATGHHETEKKTEPARQSVQEAARNSEARPASVNAGSRPKSHSAVSPKADSSARHKGAASNHDVA